MVEKARLTNAEVAQLIQQGPAQRTFDWTALGAAVRSAALDAHDGELPPPGYAYGFMLDNPECFLADDAEWPENTPAEPNIEFLTAYFFVGGSR